MPTVTASNLVELAGHLVEVEVDFDVAFAVARPSWMPAKNIMVSGWHLNDYWDARIKSNVKKMATNHLSLSGLTNRNRRFKKMRRQMQRRIERAFAKLDVFEAFDHEEVIDKLPDYDPTPF